MSDISRQEPVSFAPATETAPSTNAVSAVEARGQSLFESIPIPTYIWSVQNDVFTLTDFNAAAARWAGEDIRTLLNKTADEIYHDRPDILGYFRACMAQRTVITHETGYRLRSTPTERVIELTFSYVTSQTLLLHINDITAHRMAEAALRKEQANLRALLENTASTIWSVDSEYRLIVGNKNFQRNIRRATGTTIESGGHGLPAEASTTDRDEWRGYYDRALRGEQFSIEILQHYFEPPAWVEFQFGPIRDEHGAVTGVTVLGRNTTERKRGEMSLRESEERFRLAFENANDGVCIVGTDGRLLRVNQRMCEIFGYTQAEMEQMSVNDLTHPDYLEVSPKFIRQAVEAHSGHDEFEKAYIHRNGHIVWARVSSSLVTGAEGEPLYFISHVQDVTARKQAEQERAQLQAQLIQSQKMEMIGRLAGGIAHDFNNMLAVILMRAELSLPLVAANSATHRNLTTIHNTAQRSAELVRQLLAFARKQTIAPRPLDLNTTVDAVLPMLQRLIGEEINLVWQPGEHLWIVEMDPSQVDQILINLCVNARDAIDSIGVIAIETANVVLREEVAANSLPIAAGEYVMITVSDNGAGIPEDALPHIFEPFFTTKEVGKGSGLGLATVDGIVQQNGGYIQVFSTPGRGATFKVYLPRHFKPAQENTQAQLTTVARGANETVLVVEDEALVLQMIEDVLQHLGYNVIVFNEPGKALQHLQDHPTKIDLLLTDIIMPEMTGRTLAERVSSLQPGVRILYISGYPADALVNDRTTETPALYLQKPFSLDVLASTVRRVLGSPAPGQ